MRIGSRTLRRRALLAGAVVAGALSGCQAPGTQFANPGVVRGDAPAGPPGMALTSPAFAQVAAGNQLPVMTAQPLAPGRVVSVGGQPAMILSAVPTYTGQPMAMGPPVAGSGGLVYPVSYAPAGPVMPAPTVMPAGSMAIGSGYPTHQVMMPSVPMMQAPMPGAPGQPTLTVVNGPNGPQYVITEVVGPATSAPANPAATPGAGQPAADVIVPAPPPALPAEATPVKAPPTSTSAPVPLPPIPPAPTPLPEATAPKAPAPLPPAVSAKPPAGPVLPAAADVSGPALGSFPPVPATTPAQDTVPKLPPPTGVADYEIPPAPVFVPAPPR